MPSWHNNYKMPNSQHNSKRKKMLRLHQICRREVYRRRRCQMLKHNQQGHPLQRPRPRSATRRVQHVDASDCSTIAVLVSKSETLHRANASIAASGAFACRLHITSIHRQSQAFDHNGAKHYKQHLEDRARYFAHSWRGGGCLLCKRDSEHCILLPGPPDH